MICLSEQQNYFLGKSCVYGSGPFPIFFLMPSPWFSYTENPDFSFRRQLVCHVFVPICPVKFEIFVSVFKPANHEVVRVEWHRNHIEQGLIVCLVENSIMTDIQGMYTHK